MSGITYGFLTKEHPVPVTAVPKALTVQHIASLDRQLPGSLVGVIIESAASKIMFFKVSPPPTRSWNLSLIL